MEKKNIHNAYGIVTAEYAAGMMCVMPECDHTSHDTEMFIHARCHMEAGVEVFVQDGWLYIRCAECQKPVMATPLLTEQQLYDANF